MAVSIHAPAKGATSANRQEFFAFLGFNPRAREGRDLLEQRELERVSPFQSTRPRRARPPSRDFRCLNLTVSIHAPAKGATFALHK